MIIRKFLYLTYYSVKEFFLSKIFYIVFFFLIFSFFVSTLVGIMAVGEEKKVLSDFFAAACGMSVVIFAIIYPPISISNEIENKRIYLILSKSISRTEWFISKYFSFLISAFIVSFVSSFISFIFVKFMKGYFLDYYYFKNVLIIFLKTVIILAVSITLSIITTSHYSTILITTMIWIISHFSSELKISLSYIKSFVQYLTYIVYLLPDFSNFSIEYEYFLYLSLHLIGWLYLGILFINKKEL